MPEIVDIDYNHHVDLVGTAHFTRRSIDDAYQSIQSLKPEDVAFELDWRRFQHLNTACLTCPKRGMCKGLCEFTGAAEALGNVDANIWLIDMTEEQMQRRIRNRMTPLERSRIGFRVPRRLNQNPVWLWEEGYKERVINNSKRELKALRKLFPSIYSVLIDERNTLMAARLAWIASNKLGEGKEPRILTFVGAAHAEGIRDLLSNPLMIRERLRELNLSFTEPTPIRRVAVH